MKIGSILPIIPAILFVLLLPACEQATEVESGKETTETPAIAPDVTDVSQAEMQVAKDTSEKPPQVSVTELFFQESEPGIEPYVTRILVNENYIRIDEAGAADGYVLFDRKKSRIFSVLHESERILVVDPAVSLGKTPSDLQLTEKVIEETDAPAVGGVKPKDHQFIANGILCYNVIALDGFLPEVTSAMQVYHRVLAAQQQETLQATPKELQTPCYKANYVYAVVSHISKGFPFEQGM